MTAPYEYVTLCEGCKFLHKIKGNVQGEKWHSYIDKQGAIQSKDVWGKEMYRCKLECVIEYKYIIYPNLHNVKGVDKIELPPGLAISYDPSWQIISCGCKASVKYGQKLTRWPVAKFVEIMKLSGDRPSPVLRAQDLDNLMEYAKKNMIQPIKYNGSSYYTLLHGNNIKMVPVK